MARPLHVAVAARALSLPAGGVPTALETLLDAMLAARGAHRFTLYYDDPAWIGRFPGSQERVLQAPHKFIWDHWALPRQVAKDRPDVVWFPHNVRAVGVRAPTVVSVMDMMYFPAPWFPPRSYHRLDTWYMRLFMTYSLWRAARVIAISNHTAQDIVRILNVSPDKIVPVPLAASPAFQPLPPAEARRLVAERFGVQGPYFLYVGTLAARKNVALLLDAFAQARAHVAEQLLLVGAACGTVPEVILDGLRAPRVRRLGKVSQSELVALYSAATAFVFPSLYEGFGIPLLEAFACACPVLCACTSSLPEVAGDAALQFNPHDSGMLAAQLRLIAGDAALRTTLGARGLRRARQFSASGSAQRLIHVLEQVAA